MLVKIGHILDKIMKYAYIVSCIILWIFSLMIALNVVLRYTGMPILWADEVIGYAILFITFMSASWILRLRGHVTMDIFLEKLSLRGQAILNGITSLVAALMWLLITFYGSKVVIHLFHTQEVITTVIEPTKAYLVLIIPIGSALICLQSIRDIFHYFHESRRATLT